MMLATDTRYSLVNVVKHHEEANILVPIELSPSKPCSTLAVFSLLVCFSSALTEEVSDRLREVEDGGHFAGCGETTPGLREVQGTFMVGWAVSQFSDKQVPQSRGMV